MLRLVRPSAPAALACACVALAALALTLAAVANPGPSVFARLAAVTPTATSASTSTSASPDPAPAGPEVTLTLYWGDGCPTCEAERRFLDDLQREHPQLRIEQFEVWHDEANRARFAQAMSRHGLAAGPVPTTIVRDRVWIGFTDAIGADMRRVVGAALRGEPVPTGLYGRAGEGTCDTELGACLPPEPTTVDVPLFGRVDVGSRSLVVSTLVIGFVDGINPCSLWVISILLTIVIRTGSRRRVITIGSAFLAVTAAMYGLYMVGIYSALTVVGYLPAIQVVVALAAGVLGLVAVKDYVWFKHGVSASIPEGSKPSLYRRMRGVAASPSLPAALGATALLAMVVSLLETPCTAGFPILWTGLLAANDVDPSGAALLFLLYMIPFLVDELLVFGVAVATMRAFKLQEKHGRLLKLVAGVFMLALAGTMLVRPSTMESVSGASIVFLAAAATAAGIHALARHRRLGIR